LRLTFIEALHLSTSDTYIFIDGLDEIEDANGDGLLDLLQLIHEIREVSTADSANLFTIVEF
jgi:hypothetical protein